MGALNIFKNDLEGMLEKIKVKKENEEFNNLKTALNSASEKKENYGKIEKERIFDMVWPFIKNELTEPKTIKELSLALDVVPKQMEAWLKKALQEQIVVKVGKKAKYSLAEETNADQLNLV